MCGIIGIISENDVVERIYDGLKRLEYRGYDSAGIATVYDHLIQRRREEGKLDALRSVLDSYPLKGNTGIGHTRWATHGPPTLNNAHPHTTDEVAVVHNGIIENFQDLREKLQAKGHIFSTETDTEVIPTLITEYLAQGNTPQNAVQKTLQELQGAFALGILFKNHEDMLIAAKKGSPLAIGYGENQMFLASDAIAMAPFTQEITYLKEGDMAVLSKSGALIFDEDGKEITRKIRHIPVNDILIGKGDYSHFMLKEIYEQPTVIGETLNAYCNPISGELTLPPSPFAFAEINHLTIIACGTSYYAGMVAKYWFQKIANIAVDVDIASEFRYSDRPLPKGGVALFISQSGETADTIAALEYAKSQGQHIIALVNTEHSTLTRLADYVLRTLAGPEIGVASTKAFTTQLTVLATLVLAVAKERSSLPEKEIHSLINALIEVPAKSAEVLNHNADLKQFAETLAKAHDIIYIGRGTSYAIALEGALKLKEISYIHAEGVAAGELKHGPIALIDDNVPVVVIAPYDSFFEKTASNVQEVVARNGKVTFLSDKKGIKALAHLTKQVIEMPSVNPFVAPILYTIPVQLLAYEVAIHKGTDVDQPRNLAKSVTVE